MMMLLVVLSVSVWVQFTIEKLLWENSLGLLTLLRLWRVLRVINGFILGAKQAADKRVHEQKRRVEELEKEIASLKQQK